MEENFYRAPASSLDKVDHVESAAVTDKFYVVAPAKFLALYMATLGYYGVYWFYRNWKQFKQQTGEDMWPVPRAIFSVFFTHQLARYVNYTLDNQGRSFDWNASLCATWLVVLQITANLSDRMASKGLGSPYSDALGLLLLPVLALVHLKMQRAINAACGDTDGATNSKLSGANWAWIIAGGLVWALALFGLFGDAVE